MNSICNTHKVKYVGICGSDINKAKEVSFHEKDILKLGHEIVCCSNTDDLYVVKPFICDPHCTECEQGSYMHCDKTTRLGSGVADGGYSGKVSVPADNLYKVPACSHPEVGVLCDGAAVVLHGFHMMEWQNIQKLAIIGAGSIGMMAALIAKEKNPYLTVDIFYKSTKKKDFLNKHWADSFNYMDINEMPSMHNCYDVVLEAVGGKQSDTITYSIDIVKNSGTILVYGAFSEKCNSLNKLRQLFYKQITLIGVNSFCEKCDDFQRAVDWTFAHEELLFPLLTDFYAINRDCFDAKGIYQSVRKHKICKGCFVYE